MQRICEEDGKLISLPSLDINMRLYCGSYYCIKDGITIIDIECIGPDCECSAIGILSNIEEFKQGKWISVITGYKYWWNHGGGMFGEKDTTDIIDPCLGVADWKKGDIITLQLDMIEGYITFYLNKEVIHGMALQQDIEYYFVMVTLGNSGYRIL